MNVNLIMRPEVADNVDYQSNLQYMGIEHVRHHASGITEENTNHTWLDFNTQSWDFSKIQNSIGRMPYTPESTIMSIPRWPAYMDTDGNNQLDPDQYDAYAALCADLVDIVHNQLGMYFKYWEPINELEKKYAGELDLLAEINNRCVVAMRAVDPTIKIVGGSWIRPTHEKELFLQLANFDVWAHHHYAMGHSSEGRYRMFNNIYEMAESMDIVRAQLDANGKTGVPILLTEHNIFWTWTGDTENDMTGVIGGAWDAMLLKELAENPNCDGAYAWLDADTRYGKISYNWDDWTYNIVNPGAHVYHFMNSLCVGDVYPSNSSNTDLVETFAVENGNSFVYVVINRSDINQQVLLNDDQFTPSNYYKVWEDGVTTGNLTTFDRVVEPYAVYFIQGARSSATDGNKPAVEAGHDRFLILPNSQITLTGTSSETTGIDRIQWTQISGPNTVAIMNENSESATASGFVAGSYVFQLKAMNGKGDVGSDTVGVQVFEAGWDGVSINFGTNENDRPVNYFGDTGEPFAPRNTLSYGWNEKQVSKTRNAGNPDPLDQVVQLATDALWEMIIPNGEYTVTLGAGDKYGTNPYLNVEGVNFYDLSNLSPFDFQAVTKSVVVSDNKLSLDNGTESGRSARITHLIIQLVELSDDPGPGDIPGQESPYGGAPAPVPGKVEAENYNLGGQNVAYYDDSSGNNGQVYRQDDVDIFENQSGSEPGEFRVDNIEPGEYLNYQVDATGGIYSITFRVSSHWGTQGDAIRLTIDGVEVARIGNLSRKWSNESFVSLTIDGVSISGGQHQVRVEFLDDGFALNYLEFNKTESLPDYAIYTDSLDPFEEDGGATQASSMTVTTGTPAPEGSEYTRVVPSNNYSSYEFLFASPIDANVWSEGALSFSARTDDGSYRAYLKDENGNRSYLPINQYGNTDGSWSEFRIPLADFAINLSQIQALGFARTWNTGNPLDFDDLRIALSAETPPAQNTTNRIEAESYNRKSTNLLDLSESIQVPNNESGWAEYDGVDAHAGTYELELKYATKWGGENVTVSLNGQTIASFQNLNQTWGDTTFKTVSLIGVPVPASANGVLRIDADDGRLALDYIEFR